MTIASDFELCRVKLDTFDRIAADQGRDLTPTEAHEYSATLTRMNELTSRASAADANAAVTRRTLTNINDRPSMGEELLLRARAGLESVGNAKFAGAADELGRVVAHGVAADGTAPVTIEGDLIKFVDANRYAVNASRHLPMPDNHAPTFKRPRASQLTTVAQQVTEGDILSSQRLQLTGDTITKTTRGGVLALSEQEIDWTDPALLGLATQDLAEQYAVATDTVLTAAIVAAASDATETILAASEPTAAQFVTAITTAAGVVYAASKTLPDVLFVDVNWWTRIAALVDTTGRPLFSTTGPFNTFGQVNDVRSFQGNVLGLQLVVDPNFAADTMIVAASKFVEFYEQNKGLLTINVPSTLEVQIAYRGYVAANVYAQGLGLIEAV
jgi:hypothetical protein